MTGLSESDKQAMINTMVDKIQSALEGEHYGPMLIGLLVNAARVVASLPIKADLRREAFDEAIDMLRCYFEEALKYYPYENRN